jgi:hypothetical protein
VVTKDEQVDHIVLLMLDLEWHGMKTRRELAAEWGCHERTVGTLAERANAIVARRGKPIEDAIDAKLADLERLQQKAEQAGEFKDAIGAIKLYCEIRGVLSKQRGKSEEKALTEDEYAKLPRAERIAKLKAAYEEEMAAAKEEMQ